MAPIEHEYLNDNSRPLTLLGVYAAVTSGIVGLIAHRVLYRAYKALPPSQGTRQRKDHRRRHVAIFAGLTAVSFGLAMYYIASIVNISYQVWAYERGDLVPSWIWGGEDVFAKDGSLTLQLGRWLEDTDVFGDSWEVATSNSRRLWWTQQLFLGRAAWSLFVAIDGHRRNIPHLWAFISLITLVSLSFAQNLYFMAALLTPTPLGDAEKHSDLIHRSASGRVKSTRKASKTLQDTAATAEHAVTGVPHRIRSTLDYYFPPKPEDWTPHSLIYSVPILLQVSSAVLTGLAVNTTSFHPLLTQTFLSLFAPVLIFRLCPLQFGSSHSSRAQSGRRALNAFRLVAFLSLIVHFARTVIAVLDNDTSRHRHYYFFKDRRTVFQHTSSSAGRVLNAFAEHPAIGRIAWDVLFSGASLIIWASVRGIAGGDMLRAASLANKKELEIISDAKHYVEDKVHKLVDHVSDDEEPVTPTVSKTRQRKNTTSKKKTNGSDLLTIGESGDMARSYEGDAGKGRNSDEDKDEDWESGALAWGLLIFGGLGATASAVLGGDVV